ncbi:MAG: translocation/assembly module TamB domain-containing protein [Ignavibacteriae bacterium]|nr:translocation/assembly module TamB domain-containing protein [Ignavibacteriota bacterium]
MALSKKARTWLIILSIPVVLLVGAAVALKLYFTSDRLKALIIPKMEEATGHKVAINDISLSVFPTIAVDVSGLTIENAPGFSEKPLLSLERMLIDVKLSPLFDKRVEISSLYLEKPSIMLETAENGTTNYSTKEAAQEEPASGGGTSAAVLLSDFRIVNGYIEMIDRRDNSKQVYNGFHEMASVDFNPATQEARIESKTAIDNYSYGSITTPLVQDWRINVNADVVYTVSQSLASITNGEGFLNAIPFGINGTIAMKDKPDMNLTIEAKDVNVAQLLNLTPKAYVEKIKGVKGDGAVQAKILVKGIYDSDTRTLPDVSGTITTANASIQYPNIPKPITNININSDFFRGKSKQEFHLRTLTATLGNNPLSVTLDVISFDDPALTMAMKAAMNLAEVKDYYPLEAGTTLAGQLSADVNVAGKVSNPDAMKASGKMEFQGVTVATAGSKNPVKNLNGAITFSNQVVESKKLSMMIGKSDLALSFAMRNYLSMMSEKKGAPRPTATASLTSNHLYTADIMSDEKPAQQKTAEQKPAKKAAMPLPDVQMDVTTNIGTLTMERMEMKNVRGRMRIANGQITMDNLSMNMFDGAITSKGSVNLQNPQRPTFNLDLDMNSLKANSALSTFTSFGQRLMGDMNMNIALSGALDDTLGLIPSSLNGAGTVALNNGKLHGVKVNQQIASMLNVSDVAEMTFKDWGNAFTIKDGKVNIPELKIAALGADYTISGSQGLDGSMNFGMAMLLSDATSAKVKVPGFAGEAVNALKEPNGRVKLDFLVTGTMSDPKVALDSKALQARAAEFAKSKLEAEKKKVTDEAKKKGEDLLKGLFKKKK